MNKKEKAVNFSYSTSMDAKNIAIILADSSGLVNKEWILSTFDPDLSSVIKNSSNETMEKDIETWMNLPKNANNVLSMIGEVSKIEDLWHKCVGNQVISFLEYLYQKPFDFNNISAYATSAPMCVDNFKENEFFFISKNSYHQTWNTAGMNLWRKHSLSVIAHELNHFMFYKYYGDLEKTLSASQFLTLKESLIFFSDPASTGYAIERPLRDFYLSLDRNRYSLDEIIKLAVAKLLNQ